MFKFFQKDNNIYSPVTGKCVSIEKVPDPVFSSKMMGDGVAFIFEGDTVYAPCDCEIMLIAHTLHAIGLKASNGAEILIHIGLETVNLGGEGFEKLVEIGDRVKKGTPLLKMNRSFMKERNVNLITPMILTNSQNLKYEINQGIDVCSGKSEIIIFR